MVWQGGIGMETVCNALGRWAAGAALGHAADRGPGNVAARSARASSREDTQRAALLLSNAERLTSS